MCKSRVLTVPLLGNPYGSKGPVDGSKAAVEGEFPTPKEGNLAEVCSSLVQREVAASVIDEATENASCNFANSERPRRAL